MLHIESLTEGIEVFKALGSEIRVAILNILLEDNKIGMNELAERLQITNGALTSHIKKLESCGLISISAGSGRHGNQKIYTVHPEKILIDLAKKEPTGNMDTMELSVGHYLEAKVLPGCGLATPEHIIGVMDDERYFMHPQRYEAQMLWFHRGYVEYEIPNFLSKDKEITQISITAELGTMHSSEILFSLNGICIGKWNALGIEGTERGLYTPEWWNMDQNRYGTLKLLVINTKGTFLDGLQISEEKIQNLGLNEKSSIRLHFAVDEPSDNAGGLAIYGKGFGNYGQGIKVNISYVEK